MDSVGNYREGTALRKVGKLQETRVWGDRRQEIWAALIQYVNAGGVETTGRQLADSFKAIVSLAMHRVGGTGEELDTCKDVERIIASLHPECVTSPWSHYLEALEILASRYQSQMRTVLAWLANPGSDQELADRAVEIIRAHGSHMRMHWEAAGYDANEPECPILFEYPEYCHSVISPVCKFIKDQLDRHDLDGEELKDLFPFGLCDRPGCGRFRMFKLVRPGLFFCHPQCKSAFHQAMKSKADKAAYMRDWRSKRDRNKPKPLKRKNQEVAKNAAKGRLR
jgi:hypothetical protein